MADFILDSLRGGLDDFSPVTALVRNACTVAENVEHFFSTLGERRAGTAAATLPGGVALDDVIWLHHHTPTQNAADDELWMLTRDTITSIAVMYRYNASGWHTVTAPSGSHGINVVLGAGEQVYGISFHGKLFLCYKSGQNRTHVWDGVVWRPSGLSASHVPTAVDTGVGAYSSTRYYRTRTISRSVVTNAVLLRSEPSPVLTFTPGGAGAAVRVTFTGGYDAAETTVTHWELEASVDGVTFYRIAVVDLATTFYDDSNTITTYTDFTLSDPLLSYSVISARRYLAVDKDRLLYASTWNALDMSNPAAYEGSRVEWTPPGTDPLPGADERLDNNTSPRVDLDGQSGGDITGIVRSSVGQLLVGKWSHIYTLTNTGNLVGAYEADLLTGTRGVLPRSFVEASDQDGNTVTYMLEPKVGPMRYGIGGLKFAGHDVHNLWGTVNIYATLPCHGVYYSKKLQVHYWLSTYNSVNGAQTQYPNQKLVLQTNLTREDQEMGVRGGWTTATGRIAEARCSAMFVPDITNATPTPNGVFEVPFIGKALHPEFEPGNSLVNVLQQCDTDTTDGGIDFDPVGAAYVARVRSSAIALKSILNVFGVLSGAVLASANSVVDVRIIRDFGVETLTRTATCTPVNGATHVIAALESLTISELQTVQIEFRDNAVTASQWQLFQFALVETDEETA